MEKDLKVEKSKNKIICVDIDDVCVPLVPYWLSLYNEDSNDNLSEKDILSWNVSNYVKPEYKDKIFSYIRDQNVYEKMSPIRGSLKYTRKLKEDGFRLIYVTFRGGFHLSGRKYGWLNDNGFDVDERDYIETNDKSLILADYMIDDNYENVIGFRGCGVLYSKPWNVKENHCNRVKSWREFYEFILEKER